MTSTSRPWESRAACSLRRDLPWTTDATSVTDRQGAAMRQVCASCPVLLDCLAAVDELDVTGGWWAGADRDAWPPTETRRSSGPEVCWKPRRVRGSTHQQAAFFLARDDSGHWCLGGLGGDAA